MVTGPVPERNRSTLGRSAALSRAVGIVRGGGVDVAGDHLSARFEFTAAHP
jgi:hypothetical protein